MSIEHLLVINAGSSSIKFAVYEFDSTLKLALSGYVENLKTSPVLKIFSPEKFLIRESDYPVNFTYQQFYKMLVDAFESNQFNFKISVVGHRVVHGGNQYQLPVLIHNDVIQYLKSLIPFAPLHQPFNIEAIERIRESYPAMKQVACFDTAFHRTHPLVADWFGLPRKLTESGIHRYGFHGLSYEYIIHQLLKCSPDQANKRIVVAHLGNGSSMCAIKDKKSISSTMGFTALDGLMMGTRCGNLDPGVILYLLQYQNMSAKDIEEMLYKNSGLLGVSGISSNMKILLEDDTLAAKQAIELYVYRIQHELGALVSALHGLDLLIFTGGIGEHAWQIREQVCENSEWLGMEIDSEFNKGNKPIISTSKSKVEVRVMPTNEEWIIAHHTYQLIKGV